MWSAPRLAASPKAWEESADARARHDSEHDSGVRHRQSFEPQGPARRAGGVCEHADAAQAGVRVQSRVHHPHAGHHCAHGRRARDARRGRRFRREGRGGGRGGEGGTVNAESFTAKILLDATDRMNAGDPIATQYGVQPEIDVLRSMVEPKIQTPDGARTLAALGEGNSRAFARDEYASVLLF